MISPEWLHNPFALAFAGGIAIALLSSVLSVFVVLKRMAFVGEGIAHAAFGGAGVAMLLGLILPQLGSPLGRDGVIALFCVSTAVVIGMLSRRGRLAEDTSIGIMLVAAMALGVLLRDLRQHLLDIFPSLAGSYVPSFESLLFGQVLAISPADVLMAWGLCVITVGLVALTFKELTFTAFDEETATVFGVRTGLFYYGLLVLLGLAVVAAMRSLGIILVGAVLVLPGAAARMLSHRIAVVTLLSAAIGVTGMVAGLLLAMWLDFLSAGPLIALTYCLLLLLSYAIRRLRST